MDQPRSNASEPTPNSAFVPPEGVYDFSPEDHEELSRRMEAASHYRDESLAYLEHAQYAREIGDKEAERHYLKRYAELADFSTLHQNHSELILRRHNRRKKLKGVARQIAGVMRRPLGL